MTDYQQPFSSSIGDDPIPNRWRFSRRRRQLDLMQDLLTRIDTALIVRDPGTARSADAFEGLRKQVIASAGDRRKHLVQLTELAEALRRGDTIEAIASRTQEWLLQAGIVTVDDPSDQDAFDNAGAWDGPVKVLSPAYIDSNTGSAIRRGLVEPDEVPAPVELDTADDAAADFDALVSSEDDRDTSPSNADGNREDEGER